MKRRFDKKLFALLALAFIVATVIGTLSHESGHYLMAKHYGYDARISYSSTSYEPYDKSQPFNSTHDFYIILAGPVQTMLTGTIGLLLLFAFQRSFYLDKDLTRGQWLLVFLSLFWLRQTANLITWIGGFCMNGSFGTHGDEIRLANQLHVPYWSVATITGLIGAVVLAIVIFKFIPLKQRFTFILAGLTGGIAGYILWLALLGKYILP